MVVFKLSRKYAIFSNTIHKQHQNHAVLLILPQVLISALLQELFGNNADVRPQGLGLVSGTVWFVLNGRLRMVNGRCRWLLMGCVGRA